VITTGERITMPQSVLFDPLDAAAPYEVLERVGG
jgi:hypothetical protein